MEKRLDSIEHFILTKYTAVYFLFSLVFFDMLELLANNEVRL